MHSRFILFGFLFVSFLTGSIYSQPKPPSKRDMFKQLKSRLELTDEQAKKIDEILSVSEKKMKALRDKMEEQNDNMMYQMDSVVENQDKEIEKILTDTQKKEYKEVKKERENMRPPMGDKPEPPTDDFPRPPHGSDFE